MSRQRMLDTCFWDDSYVQKLDPSEKLLFLYLLTNPLTNIAGVYEIALRRICFDTGFDQDTVLRMLGRLERDGRCVYRDGWIALRNWIKHQRKAPGVLEGIRRQLATVPTDLAEYARGGSTPVQPPLNQVQRTPNLTQPNSTKPNLEEAPAPDPLPPFDELPQKPPEPPAPAAPVPSGPDYRKQLQKRLEGAEHEGDAAAMLVYGLELLHGGPFASYQKEWTSAKKLSKSLTTMSRGNADLCTAARDLLRVYQHKRRTSRETYWKEAPLTPSGLLCRLEQLVSFAGKQRENQKLDEISAKAMRSRL